jgi:hypothetical protein
MAVEARSKPRGRLDGRDRWALLIVAIASLLVGVIHVPQHQQLSPLDEYVYTDYLSKMPQQLMVRQGEMTGDYARAVVACRPPRMLPEKPPKDCTYASVDLDVPDGALVMGGKTSADIYTPLYFLSTWAVSEPLRLVGVDDPLTRGRLAGSLWLALAACVLLITMRRLRVGRRAAVGTTLLMVGSIPAYWASTYVTTDAPSLLAGAGVLYALVSHLQGGLARRWFVLLAVLVTLAKFQNLTIVAVAALVMMLTAWVDQSVARSGRRLRPADVLAWLKDWRVVTALAAPAAAMLAQFVWLAIHAAAAVSDSPDQGVDSSPTLALILGDVRSFFPGALNQGVSDPEGSFVGTIVWITGSVAVAGVGGLLLASRRRSFDEILAISTLAGAVLAPLALALVVVGYSGTYIPPTARYGLVLVPAYFTCAALLSRSKQWTASLLLVLGALVYGMSLTIPG